MFVSQIALSYLSAFKLSGLFSFFLFLFWEQKVGLPQCRVFGALGGCWGSWDCPALSQGHKCPLWTHWCHPARGGCGTGVCVLLLLCLLCQHSPPEAGIRARWSLAKAEGPAELTPAAQPPALPSGSPTSPRYSQRLSLNYREQTSLGALLILVGFPGSSKGFSCPFKQALTLFLSVRCSVLFVILYWDVTGVLILSLPIEMSIFSWILWCLFLRSLSHLMFNFSNL